VPRTTHQIDGDAKLVEALSGKGEPPCGGALPRAKEPATRHFPPPSDVTSNTTVSAPCRTMGQARAPCRESKRVGKPPGDAGEADSGSHRRLDLAPYPATVFSPEWPPGSEQFVVSEPASTQPSMVRVEELNSPEAGKTRNKIEHRLFAHISMN
jgi:hypothetical protein